MNERDRDATSPMQLAHALILPLIAAQDVHELARAILHAVDTLIACDYTGFYFLNPQTYRLELVLAKGFSEAERLDAETTMDRRHPGWVVRARRALYVADTTLDPLTTQHSAPSLAAIRSRFYVPLVYAGQCVGTLGIAARRAHAFSEEDRETFVLICDFAARTHSRLVEIAQLRQSRRQLETAISAADEGLWEWNVPSGVVDFSATWKAMLGYGPDELSHRQETFFQMLHPDDVPLVSAALRAHFQENVAYAVEVRMQRKDGGYSWVLARGHALRDERGEVRTMSGTHVDLTALKAAEEALRGARDAALAASRLKSEFVANVSHEIRTPMNGIIGIAHLMQQTTLTPQQREYAVLVQTSAEALLGVLNDVLDFSKVESGRLDLKVQPFALGPVIADALATTSGIAASKGLPLVSDLPTERLEVLADPLRVRQVLLNLLGNALKFTEHGSISVRVRATHRATVRVEVSDSGIGIAQEAAEVVFQPFRQADGSTTRRFGGTGLGLAISHQLITLMAGTIGHEPRGEGGTTFWFELPVPTRVAATAPQLVCTLDSDVIELRLLNTVLKGSQIQRLDRLEDLQALVPSPDLLIVAGSTVKPELLAAALAQLPPTRSRPAVVVRTTDYETVRAYAACGFGHAVSSVRELRRAVRDGTV